MLDQNIAFIGLGNMGGPMAINIHRAGYAVTAYDLSTDALNKMVDEGVGTAESALAATENADVVISMLPASNHVETLYLGENGLLNKLKPNTLLIDCSTISPTSAQKIADAAHARNLLMIDAPVSGGVSGAQKAGLTFIVGGEKKTVKRADPVLRTMGKNIFHMGPAGAGQVAKLCNNMALGVIMATTAEAIALGVAHGLDPKILSDMIAVSTGRSWATEICNPWPNVIPNAPASNGYQGGFGNDLMLKDLGLAIEAAIDVRATVSLGELARNLYAMNSLAGRGSLDFSSVVQLMLASSESPA
ncbi:3-hydroxyisobutyrate dehydrogenase [Alcaligenes sp. 13f]|uniref:3-hydroxyisobutyrate dehydrogenase n=1 Tax=Alcaligenes sp. 13f TaxID=2841924 RepID=UPI001CF65627|nr:3-hydroxyisobutyrate dehydrogenase [Alcaligenes sp. 13f]MCB4321563.1 3-hydroxyisobutyrate dehydrogenase [Alcaligenes sp. 13f]